MKNLRKAFTIGLIFLVGTYLMAEQLVITTGSKKGNYYKVGQRIKSQFPNTEVITSRGSIENFDRLMGGKQM